MTYEFGVLSNCDVAFIVRKNDRYTIYKFLDDDSWQLLRPQPIGHSVILRIQLT